MLVLDGGAVIDATCGELPGQRVPSGPRGRCGAPRPLV